MEEKNKESSGCRKTFLFQVNMRLITRGNLFHLSGMKIVLSVSSLCDYTEFSKPG